MSDEKNNKKANSKPVSLYPLSFKEALFALLATKPPPKGERRKNKQVDESGSQ